MKRAVQFLLTLLAALSVLGCASLGGGKAQSLESPESTDGIPDYSKAKGAVRIMTYNVGVFGKYVENSIPIVADLLKEAQPDIVGLNELDSCNTRHRNYQLQDLNTCLGKGWNFVFQSMFPYQGGGYGVGVETTHKVTGTRSYDIPKTPGVKHKGLLAVETEDFVFMSTHLNVTGDISLEQAKLINEYVRKDYWAAGKPVFLAEELQGVQQQRTADDNHQEGEDKHSARRIGGERVHRHQHARTHQEGAQQA